MNLQKTAKEALEMDLTETQWETIFTLIPEPHRRTDGRGRPWRPNRDILMVCSGFSAQQLHGKIHRIAIHRIKPVIGDSSNAFDPVCWSRC